MLAALSTLTASRRSCWVVIGTWGGLALAMVPLQGPLQGREADRSEAVKSIDETLLIVTCAVLVLLLLAIYRSPFVALVPLAVVGVAYVVAGGLTYLLVEAGVTGGSGQTTAILIVLMFGAGTDYCLLIVARFRDELRRTADVGEAMSRATRRTGPAILSAGGVLGGGVLGGGFSPGRAAPRGVGTDFDAKGRVIAALTEGRDTPVQEMYLSAASVPPNGGTRPEDSELALADAYLRIDPFSDAATDAVPELREKAREAAGGRPVLIGGEVAEAFDTREALARDTSLIVPISLALILIILALLLRAVVMPLYVVATVILSYGFALGVSSLIFTHVMDQPASDPSLPVFTFIFLVALGVDYNVFLLARIREERSGRDTASAVTTALERTGGVITSAGLVLAATFSVLMALPLEALFQVGFVVALGLLADTFLVRALLVPSLAVLLGERNWWPQELLSSGSTEALDKPTKAA